MSRECDGSLVLPYESSLSLARVNLCERYYIFIYYSVLWHKCQVIFLVGGSSFALIEPSLGTKKPALMAGKITKEEFEFMRLGWRRAY